MLFDKYNQFIPIFKGQKLARYLLWRHSKKLSLVILVNYFINLEITRDYWRLQENTSLVKLSG